jgi:hypothetical protein
MGAWGVGIFENDSASDWWYSFDDEPMEALAAAFASTRGVDFVEGDAGCAAAAAAEIIARAHDPSFGEFSPEKVERIDEMRNAILAAPALKSEAAAALKAVLGQNSELAQLWAEEDEFEAWKASINDVLNKLTA